ncbi:FKBP-type peptidyl-prolyl cis-trans isomerase, partial [archaeon]|nr:FKBP-type peptidyl-prolyl cis-trans isomerase [archaeon]
MALVKISYTGKIKDSGKVFDTTLAEEARKAGIFDDKKIYGPAVVSLGKKELIKGLDEALQKMAKGEEKKIELKPADAFGE